MNNNLTNTLRYIYDKYSEYESGALPETVDKFFFMGSPVPIIAVIVAYLAFIFYIGPSHMKNRQPYDITNLLIAYNIFQILYNFYMLYLYYVQPYFPSQFFSFGCSALTAEQKRIYFNKAFSGFWFYTMNKGLDLVDTIFLVLRKNQNRITVLHVYHHIGTFVVAWCLLKYYPGQEAAIVGILNTAIHFVMYSYYLIAALGPKYRKYLWWKKYITKMQIAQFLIILVYHLLGARYSCGFNSYVVKAIVVHTVVNLAMFCNFYYHAYIKPEKKLNVTNGTKGKQSNGKKHA